MARTKCIKPFIIKKTNIIQQYYHFKKRIENLKELYLKIFNDNIFKYHNKLLYLNQILNKIEHLKKYEQFKRYIINKEELCKFAFKPSRIVYYLSLDEDYNFS